MTAFRIAAIVVGISLAISGASFAAKRTIQTSDAKDIVKPRSRAIKSSGSAIHPHSYDPYSYGRDPDPYAPGVNWPKGA